MTANDDLNARIDKMGAWAKDTTASIVKLQGQMVVGVYAQGDQLALDLGALFLQYEGVDAKILKAMKARNCTVGELDKLQDGAGGIDDLEGRAFVKVFAKKGDDGKATYSNPQARNAAVRGILEKNETYQGLKREKDTAKRKLTENKALIEFLERQLKEYGRRNAAIVAKLAYITARIERSK